MDICEVQLNAINKHFSMTCEITKIDRHVLLTVLNPIFEDVIEKFPDCEVQLNALNKHFSMTCEITKIDRHVLLTVLNPIFKDVIEKFPDLKEVKMDDDKVGLPIYVILCMSDYSRAKTSASAIVGGDGESAAEKIKFGWVKS